MNPSSWKMRIPIILIALIATVIATILALFQWKVIDWVWDPVFGDGSVKVLTSKASHEIISWIRIPDSILGSFAYISDIVFALAGSQNRWQDRPWLVIIFGISVIPVGCVSILLVLTQGLIVKHYCFWCLSTASASLILIFLAYNEVITSCRYLNEIKKRGGWKIAWWNFWGYPSQEALDAAEVILAKRRSNRVG